MNYYSKISFLFFALQFILFSNLYAQPVVISLVNGAGNVVEKISIDLNTGKESADVAQRMSLNWFCFAKKVFNGLSCFDGQPVQQAVLTPPRNEYEIHPNGNLAQNTLPNSNNDQNSQSESAASVGVTSSDKVIY